MEDPGSCIPHVEPTSPRGVQVQYHFARHNFFNHRGSHLLLYFDRKYCQAIDRSTRLDYARRSSCSSNSPLSSDMKVSSTSWYCNDCPSYKAPWNRAANIGRRSNSSMYLPVAKPSFANGKVWCNTRPENAKKTTHAQALTRLPLCQ